MLGDRLCKGAQHGDLDEVRKMLEAGININFQSKVCLFFDPFFDSGHYISVFYLFFEFVHFVHLSPFCLHRIKQHP